jgi:hypothetical protein
VTGANDAGGKDNITVIVARFGDAAKQESGAKSNCMTVPSDS